MSASSMFAPETSVQDLFPFQQVDVWMGDDVFHFSLTLKHQEIEGREREGDNKRGKDREMERIKKKKTANNRKF